VIITIKYNVDGYPGFMSKAYSDMYNKLYYRVPPLLIGISVSIFHFEYKYVDKLKDGSQPFHKNILKKLTEKKNLFKCICYLLGLAFCIITVLLLVLNSQSTSSGSYIHEFLNSSLPAKVRFSYNSSDHLVMEYNNGWTLKKRLHNAQSDLGILNMKAYSQTTDWKWDVSLVTQPNPSVYKI
jgi:hypothetical protein